MNYRYPKRDQVNMVVADEEYSYTFPADTKKFILQLRSGEEFKMAFVAGDIVLDKYFTIHQGIAKVEEGHNLDDTLTIYFSCATDGEVMEIEAWR